MQVKYTWLFADEDGASCFEDLTISNLGAERSQVQVLPPRQLSKALMSTDQTKRARPPQKRNNERLQE